MSDLALMRDFPAIKCGPGATERSHTPDEFVFESEILEGACFYEKLIQQYAKRLTLIRQNHAAFLRPRSRIS